MTKESFLQDLEAFIGEAAEKIKPLILAELYGMKLPLLKIGIHDSQYQQKGIPRGGNHWRGDWEVAPSMGIAAEMPGYVLNSDASFSIEGYAILTPSGIFHMNQEPFFCDHKKRDTSNFPSWNTRREIPEQYITYAQTAIHIISCLNDPRDPAGYSEW